MKHAAARWAEAEGESFYIEQTGTGKGAEVRAVGVAKAEAYEAQVKSFGACLLYTSPSPRD